MMTSLFQQSTSLVSLATFQHNQRMEFTFHNSYVILELEPSTLISGQRVRVMVFNANFNDISAISQRSVYWWRKPEYPDPAADAQATQTRSLCSQGEVITTTILLLSSQSGRQLRSIHISNDNGSFTFYVDIFFLLSLPILLSDLIVYMSNTAGVL